MRGILYIFGFVGGFILVMYDFVTSVMGLSQFIPSGSVIFLLPFAGALLCLAMNGAASQMVVRLQKRKEDQFPLFLIGSSFFICLTFDALSSGIGVLTEMAQTDSVFDSFKVLSPVHACVGVGIACFVTIGPFLTAQFHEMIVEEGGFVACVSNLFCFFTAKEE